MKGLATTIIVVIVTILIALSMLGFIFLKSSGGISSRQPASQTSTDLTPSIPVKDFAPNMPKTQKTTILIQSSDSSEEEYVVPTTQVDTYVKSLPLGYHVVSKTP